MEASKPPCFQSHLHCLQPPTHSVLTNIENTFNSSFLSIFPTFTPNTLIYTSTFYFHEKLPAENYFSPYQLPVYIPGKKISAPADLPRPLYQSLFLRNKMKKGELREARKDASSVEIPPLQMSSSTFKYICSLTVH